MHVIGDGADYGIIYPKVAPLLKRELSPEKLRENFILGKRLRKDPANSSELERRYAAMEGYLSGTGMGLYEKLIEALSYDWKHLSQGGRQFVEFTLKHAMTGSYICGIVQQDKTFIHEGTSTIQ